MLTVLAPAKLNLTLEVLTRRTDGFHEIRSVIQVISLCDKLTFQPANDIMFESESPGWKAEESLVFRAATLIKGTTGYTKGAKISIGKNIPLMSGLGGDSSDAAAVLWGLNQLWGVNLSRDGLVSLAQQLGSDVSFFLYGGTALMEGRGEKVTQLPSLPHMWVVLVVPAVARLPGKTKQLYGSLRASHYTDGRFTGRLAEILNAGEEFFPSSLYNAFEKVAFDCFPGLRQGWDAMLSAGAPYVHLAGSGPTLFTLTKDKGLADELYNRLKRMGLETYLAETLSLE